MWLKLSSPCSWHLRRFVGYETAGTLWRRAWRSRFGPLREAMRPLIVGNLVTGVHYREQPNTDVAPITYSVTK